MLGMQPYQLALLDLLPHLVGVEAHYNVSAKYSSALLVRFSASYIIFGVVALVSAVMVLLHSFFRPSVSSKVWLYMMNLRPTL